MNEKVHVECFLHALCWTGHISSIWEILQFLLCFLLRKLQFDRSALLLLSPPVLCLFSWFEPVQTISQTPPLTSQDRIRVFTCDLIAKITTITLLLSYKRKDFVIGLLNIIHREIKSISRALDLDWTFD